MHGISIVGLSFRPFLETLYKSGDSESGWHLPFEQSSVTSGPPGLQSTRAAFPSAFCCFQVSASGSFIGPVSRSNMSAFTISKLYVLARELRTEGCYKMLTSSDHGIGLPGIAIERSH